VTSGKFRTRTWICLALGLGVTGVAVWLIQKRPPNPARADMEAAPPNLNDADTHGRRTAQARGPVPRLHTDPATVLPEPSAHAAFIDHTSRNRKPGERPLTLESVHAGEARHPWWADAMEQTVAARFTPEKMHALGLDSLRVDDLDCRSSSCRIIVSWDQAAQDVARQRLPNVTEKNPLELVEVETGPLGSLGAPVPSSLGTSLPGGYGARIREDGRMFVRYVFLFDHHSIDPTRYADWVRQLLAAT
jgi:hypothetical protein